MKNTKEMQLLNFIKSGENSQRRWKECRSFYTTMCRAIYKEGVNTHWTGSSYVLTAEEALKYNERNCRRAADNALYRLEHKGLVENVAWGVHKAV